VKTEQKRQKNEEVKTHIKFIKSHFCIKMAILKHILLGIIIRQP